jgi:hypothetical protein
VVGGDFGNPREWWASEKEKKKRHLNVWFGLGQMVSVHPKTAKTASSTTDVLVGAGSQ